LTEEDVLRAEERGASGSVCPNDVDVAVESRAICGSNEEPVLLERFLGVEKVVPPSVERLRKISALPGLLSAQTTLMLPFESKAICGEPDFVSLEKVS